MLTDSKSPLTPRVPLSHNTSQCDQNLFAITNLSLLASVVDIEILLASQKAIFGSFGVMIGSLIVKVLVATHEIDW